MNDRSAFEEIFMGFCRGMFFILACIVAFCTGFMHEAKKSGYH